MTYEQVIIGYLQDYKEEVRDLALDYERPERIHIYCRRHLLTDNLEYSQRMLIEIALQQINWRYIALWALGLR
jgi:hypothetical protein